MFIDKFYCCLSKKEAERYYITIQMIKEFTLKQISIDTIVQDIKVDSLELELNKLKNDNNATIKNNENNNIR